MADQVTNVNVSAEDTGAAKVVSVGAEHVIPLRKRLTSRRLWMVLFACSLPWFGLERGVSHLYALQEWQAAVYGTMFLAVMGVIGALVGKYMGIDNVSIGASTNVVGAITGAATHAFERREEKIEVDERIVEEFAERYKDDPSYVKLPPDTGEVWR